MPRIFLLDQLTAMDICICLPNIYLVLIKPQTFSTALTKDTAQINKLILRKLHLGK